MNPVRGVTLITDEEQACIVLQALVPRRPALGGEIDVVIVRVRLSQDLCALVAGGGSKTYMSVLGDDSIAVAVDCLEV
jgi:hypothetical protein